MVSRCSVVVAKEDPNALGRSSKGLDETLKTVQNRMYSILNWPQ